MFSVFPVDEANLVFQQLSRCRINGRAVLRVCSVDDDAFYNSSSSDKLIRYLSSAPASTLPDSPHPLSIAADRRDTASSSSQQKGFFLPPNSP